MKLFGVDIAKLVTQHLAPGALPATLTVYKTGGYDSNDPAAGAARTSKAYQCRAIVTKLDRTRDAAELVRMYEGEITVFLGTLPAGVVPGLADTIDIVPPGGTTSMTFVVTGGGGNRKTVDIDAAGATAVCHVKG